MKIAFIVSSFPKLSETFILNQITGLLDLGHEVEIFANHDPFEEKVHKDYTKYELSEKTNYFESIPKNQIVRLLKAIYFFITNFYKDPILLLNSINIFKFKKDAANLTYLYLIKPFVGKNIDILYCHFGPNGNVGTRLKKIGINVKLVTVFHGYDLSSYIEKSGRNIYIDLFKLGDLFLPISRYWDKKLIELRCPKNKIYIHHMGINLEKFKFSEKRKKSREPIKILTIGRLIEKKGHKYAIQAIAKIIKKYKNIEYIIAGDGPSRSKLEGLVSELRIKDHIRFLGEVEQNEVLRLYQQAHIFILPSITANNGDQEGIPIVLMEAQATGLPIVSTYHSGVPEVVVDGKSGFLVPEKDVDALAKKLGCLIEHPELWSKMGNYGRKFVKEKYNIEKLNLQLVIIFNASLTDNMNILEELKGHQ